MVRIGFVAAVILTVSVSAFAITSHVFHNPNVAEDMSDLKAKAQSGFGLDKSSEESSGIGVSYPNSRTPGPLEEVIGEWTKDEDAWLSGADKGGTIRSGITWTSVKITDSEGSLKSRRVYSAEGAVKIEYIAENPAELQAVETEYMKYDFTWMNDHYDYVPNTSQLYIVEDDEDGSYTGEYMGALYSRSDSEGYICIEAVYDAESENDNSGAYVLKNSYDDIYTYTNKDGYEFLIKVYGDCIWAECSTDYGRVSMYGGYIGAESMEEVLDNIGLVIK